MRTSERGVEFIERHEGVVLKAYRDVAGVWTIGAGLTAASGVVKPKAGMTITREDASALLAAALPPYEKAVEAHMQGAEQHAFDGGVSFQFNTGGIARASWVRAWRAGQIAQVRPLLGLWRKAGGKVIAGLVKRREAEASLITLGVYGDSSHVLDPIEAAAKAKGHARIVVPLGEDERAQLVADFRALGYDKDGESRLYLPSAAVRAFQSDHGLTVDGIIGRATLSTLQRMRDARAKAKGSSASGVAGAGTAKAADVSIDDGTLPPEAAAWGDWVAIAFLVLLALRLAWLAWTYRDAIAALCAPRLPRLAALLRSF